MNAICPRCGQGNLFRATVLLTGEQVVVCEECEALWSAGVVLTDENFDDLVAYLARRGVDNGWKALKVEDVPL